MIMHKITGLSLQKRNRQRVNVYLDGEFAFGLQRIVAAWLQVGQEISDAKIAELVAQDSHEIAYQRALNLLCNRPHSEAEIHKKLKEHEFSEDTINSVIERLRQNGLINDKNFAQAWIENRCERRPRSRRALTYELRKRGVDPETIEQLIESVDDEEMAYRVATKRARKTNNLDWNEFRQMIFRHLSQRGFNLDVITLVTDRVWGETTGKTDTPYEKEKL